MLVAPAFAPEASFVAELHTHGVSAWTTEDLITLVENGANAIDLRALLTAPGIAADAVEDFTWKREHGRTKRLRVVASLILSQAAAQQRMAQRIANRDDVPRFTVDVAMSAVDAQLTQVPGSNGCTRDDVEAAFAWLTNPLVRRAVWVDAARDAIVVV